MKKNKILLAIALSVSLTAFSGASNAALDMSEYKDSVAYSEYRDNKSAYMLRASDIIGMDLENAQGDNIGEVDDLILSRKGNKLLAIISVGGFLDIGDRLIAVPYEDLRIAKAADNVFWDTNKAALEGMTAFKYEDGEPNGYGVMTSRRQIRAGKLDAGERVGYDKSVEYSEFRNEDSNYTLRVSEILGEEIENTNGDNIGEVDDLIIARESNDLQAVVSVGSFLGIGDRLVTVPYNEMRVGGEGDELYLAATEASLKNRPAFVYNEGESTGAKLINERERYVADVREVKKEAKAEMKEVEAEVETEMKEAEADIKAGMKEAGAAVEEVKEEAGAAAATTAGAIATQVNRFKDSVGYADVRKTESPYHLRMSEIIGEDVKNANDEEIGEIDDLIMSRKDDSLMAIVSVGGFLGMGDKLVSVPYKELRVSKDGDDIYIDSTKELLESRPEFKYNEGEVFGKDTLQERMKAQ